MSFVKDIVHIICNNPNVLRLINASRGVEVGAVNNFTCTSWAHVGEHGLKSLFLSTRYLVPLRSHVVKVVENFMALVSSLRRLCLVLF